MPSITNTDMLSYLRANPDAFEGPDDERADPVASSPGAFLREWIEELGITPYALAKRAGVDPMRIRRILSGERAITPESALRIGAALHTSAEMWIGMQVNHDMREALHKLRHELVAIAPLDAAVNHDPVCESAAK